MLDIKSSKIITNNKCYSYFVGFIIDHNRNDMWIYQTLYRIQIQEKIIKQKLNSV